MVLDGVFKHMTKSLPNTASHEGAGTIVAVGSDVTTFKEGDRVMVGINLHPCGVCAECQAPADSSRSQYCTNMGGLLGVTADGAFADYMVADSRTSAKLPDAVTFETAAPLACAGLTVWRGVTKPALKPGQWLAIVGSGGGLGHLGVQFAKALGLNVIGVDARDGALELSKKNGADLVVDARKGNAAIFEEIKAVTNGEGAEATVNVSDAPTAAATACAVTRLHGTMIQIAQPENISVPFAELIFRDIKVVGSLIASPLEAEEMLKVVAKHKVSVKTNRFEGVKELPRLIEYYESGTMMGKGIVVVDGAQIEKERSIGAVV
ncbi:MAG: hypothetical protein Q9162_000698 [Coniocarpon cinnabarinum]